MRFEVCQTHSTGVYSSDAQVAAAEVTIFVTYSKCMCYCLFNLYCLFLCVVQPCAVLQLDPTEDEKQHFQQDLFSGGSTVEDPVFVRQVPCPPLPPPMHTSSSNDTVSYFGYCNLFCFIQFHIGSWFTYSFYSSFDGRV